ncbi:hypothetical protein OEZ85_000094 [Tetradesmus obliquus]|uniref:Partial AB-hydrolase lipase domain-containing protein n=1 Tax=Tetradesmus obliquus TaxID=3088 RepID=A0ABY8UQW1_TETOB|nr:hypothetical protein OEZ85_000094 [Tetradesmus obliquus]
MPCTFRSRRSPCQAHPVSSTQQQPAAAQQAAPSGFGVHERSKRRGLLEELCLGGELFVTGGFEAMRWLHSKSVGSDMAQLSLGTARGASALPRLTMRRVRSVGRWNHAGEPQPAAAAAAAAAAGVSEDELSPAAQMILKAGYPLELHQVTTADGYVLRIERIPRPGSPRVAFFLHGILDTSLTWVSAGVTGSQAFGAWDAGQDVWLGSSRSNPPRTATDPDRQGLRYFNFSLNELGIHDIPAQLDLLHSVKMRELAGSSSSSSTTAAAAVAAAGAGPYGLGVHSSTGSSSISSTIGLSPGRRTLPAGLAGGGLNPGEPYDLRVVAHSLGGMSMLVYLVMRCAAGQPHHVRRLILMSPAGYHHTVPAAFWPFIAVLPWWHRLLVLLVGRHRAYHPAVLPSYIGRALTFSYFLEMLRLPALADLTRAMMKAFFGGDSSEWERALLMPHYNAAGMPSCSLHQALHFIQIIRSGRFQLYDYGSPAANAARYGSSRPPDIGSQYWRLAGLHIDLLAGKCDGIIPPSNVLCHYQAMREQGLQVTYREFEYGHMDFTFSVKEELRYYVMKCLSRPS